MNFIKIHIWADDTFCEDEDLNEYLTFMSDDYLTCAVDMALLEDGDMCTYNQCLTMQK